MLRPSLQGGGRAACLHEGSTGPECGAAGMAWHAGPPPPSGLARHSGMWRSGHAAPPPGWGWPVRAGRSCGWRGRGPAEMWGMHASRPVVFAPPAVDRPSLGGPQLSTADPPATPMLHCHSSPALLTPTPFHITTPCCCCCCCCCCCLSPSCWLAQGGCSCGWSGL